jgi:diguanylate cyclase
MAKLEPTPANYARAWREEEGGEGAQDVASESAGAAARAAVQGLVTRLLPAGAARERLGQALLGQRWQEVSIVLEAEAPSAAQQAQTWADVIERSSRYLERSSRTWPVGRRKESLKHVLNSCRSDPQRLLQRLQSLVSSWESDSAAVAADTEVPDSVDASHDAADSVADPLAQAQQALTTALGEVAAGIATPAVRTDLPAAWPQVVHALESSLQAALPPGENRACEVGDKLKRAAGAVRDADADPATLAELQTACEEVRRVLQHRHHLVDQLGVLVNELTDGLGELAEDDSWVEGQCLAMREQLGMGLSSRGVSAVSELLGTTRQRQQQLRIERAQARDALKQLIHRMLQDIGELGAHTGRFTDSVGRYAEVIGSAESLEGLAGVVREMVEETRTVHDLVSQTTQRLHDEHERARAMADRVVELEAELRQLSQEVGTDQLTQVANRRGLMRCFDAERARVEREAAELAIGLLDIDNFKRLNDSLGHQTGDEALKFLTRRVGEALRPTDTLARYGGEEFVVLLPGTPADEAQRVLTRVQRLLSAELFMYEGKQSFVTFSAGVTLYRVGEAIEVALQRADEALYEAKRTGKNRTCVA